MVKCSGWKLPSLSYPGTDGGRPGCLAVLFLVGPRIGAHFFHGKTETNETDKRSDEVTGERYLNHVVRRVSGACTTPTSIKNLERSRNHRPLR